MFRSLSAIRRHIFASALLVCLAGGAAAAPAWASQSPRPAAQSTAANARPAAAVSDADKLDLNTATADQLKALPGIGDAYTRRIIDGRPYTAKNQLTTRGILPQKTYDAIKDSIVARRPAKK